MFWMLRGCPETLRARLCPTLPSSAVANSVVGPYVPRTSTKAVPVPRTPAVAVTRSSAPAGTGGSAWCPLCILLSAPPPGSGGGGGRKALVSQSPGCAGAI